ncbi:hypothetical protein BDP55DRAFT_236953 [Colletotrichum godetiae]|uniref:Uncharacterized protein n=1 Tax=Colletotrichum godetiae TaxID=1209918 RepID=A0AAJ0EQN0_9PEZI|nr:uncharacterized protein BDP55DRAFT_236953 [Colletotrichum godetiae]KAK1672996.1 hypothetical protein BDP55DRAFT_236953 [Colletotrichum godetiae]
MSPHISLPLHDACMVSIVFAEDELRSTGKRQLPRQLRRVYSASKAEIEVEVSNQLQTKKLLFEFLGVQ